MKPQVQFSFYLIIGLLLITGMPCLSQAPNLPGTNIPINSDEAIKYIGEQAKNSNIKIVIPVSSKKDSSKNFVEQIAYDTYRKSIKEGSIEIPKVDQILFNNIEKAKDANKVNDSLINRRKNIKSSIELWNNNESRTDNSVNNGIVKQGHKDSNELNNIFFNTSEGYLNPYQKEKSLKFSQNVYERMNVEIENYGKDTANLNNEVSKIKRSIEEAKKNMKEYEKFWAIDTYKVHAELYYSHKNRQANFSSEAENEILKKAKDALIKKTGLTEKQVDSLNTISSFKAFPNSTNGEVGENAGSQLIKVAGTTITEGNGKRLGEINGYSEREQNANEQLNIFEKELSVKQDQLNLIMKEHQNIIKIKQKYSDDIMQKGSWQDKIKFANEINDILIIKVRDE